MGLFGIKDPMKEMGGWENAMTEEEIVQMEKQEYPLRVFLFCLIFNIQWHKLFQENSTQKHKY